MAHFKKDKITKNTKRTVIGILKAALIVEISFIIAMPLINVIVRSLMDITDFYDPLVYLIPKHFTLFNYQIAYKTLNYTGSLSRLVLYVGGLTALQIAVCSLVGYGFARFEIPFKKLLFGMVVFTVVVPSHLTLIPLYAQMRSFDIFGIYHLITGRPGINLLNTYAPTALMTLTGAGLRSGLFIFLFRQSFKGMPLSLEEAAMIDGAGYGRTFIKIMLPNAIPVIVTVLLLSFVWQYNDTLYTSQFMSSVEFLSNKLEAMAGNLRNSTNFLDMKQIELITNAGVVLTLLPLVVIYLALQRFFVEGVERSGIVG